MGMFGQKPLAVTVFACLLATTAACGGGNKNAAKSPHNEGDSKGGPAEVGRPAPDLSIQTMNGKGKVSLESLQGKVAIVDFWATWCAPCKQSFPKLEELAKQNEGKVQVVGISVDDKQDGVAEFAKENGASFAIGWDDGHSIANRWHVESMPTTYILDSTGTVRYIHAGFHGSEAEEIAKEVATLNSESPSKAKTDVASAGTPAKSDATSKPETPSDTTSTTSSATASKDDPPAEKASEPPVGAKPKKGGKGHGAGAGAGTGTGGGKKSGGKKPKKKP